MLLTIAANLLAAIAIVVVVRHILTHGRRGQNWSRMDRRDVRGRRIEEA
jgi:hypothetical protein